MPRVIGAITMVRIAVLLCAVVLIQATAARALLEHPVCQAACPEDASNGGSDGGCSLLGDETIAARRVMMAQPGSPRPGRWYGAVLASAPSPDPDEILHVPKPQLA